jgi:2'-5' RNA ligase
MRSPKVVWAGMHNCDALLKLQHRIAGGLEAFGYQQEKRPFRAHVTLGRVRDGSGRRNLSALLDERQARHYGEFQAERLTFIQSDLQPSGPVYTILEESKL